jgi:hypothetical protein
MFDEIGLDLEEDKLIIYLPFNYNIEEVKIKDDNSLEIHDKYGSTTLFLPYPVEKIDKVEYLGNDMYRIVATLKLTSPYPNPNVLEILKELFDEDIDETVFTDEDDDEEYEEEGYDLYEQALEDDEDLGDGAVYINKKHYF